MNDYLGRTIRREVPQSEALPGQVANSAGGFSYAVTSMQRLERFLILGAEGGSYYAGERELVMENVACLDAVVDGLAHEALDLVLDVSVAGRAPRVSPALFALAKIMTASKGDKALIDQIEERFWQIVRTGSHLLELVSYLDSMRGWGTAARRIVGGWYLRMDADSLGYQLIKYKDRFGWTHRDVLRVTHVKAGADQPVHAALFAWVAGKLPSERFGELPEIVYASLAANPSADELALDVVIHGMPREAIPTEHQNDPAVASALAVRAPLGSLVRNLGRLTASGALNDAEVERQVAERLVSPGLIAKARLHPLNILVAMSVYGAGRGWKGGLTWTPSPRITAALGEAYMLAFNGLEVIDGKRLLIAVDVSGSMSATIAGTFLSAREGAAALTLALLKQFPSSRAMAFSGGFVPLPIHGGMSPAEAARATQAMPFDRTDCAVPASWANASRKEVGAFDGIVILTDNETWAGSLHPKVALDRYRQAVGHPVRQVVCGLVSNGFTIADPSDPLSLDIVGFDASMPGLLAEFLS